jgi:hypothetical protein
MPAKAPSFLEIISKINKIPQNHKNELSLHQISVNKSFFYSFRGLLLWLNHQTPKLALDGAKAGPLFWNV